MYAMMHKRDDSRGSLVPVPFLNMLRRASLAFCLSLALARPVPADVVKLKNGELITCKVIKEMQGLIKVRMPHRGKIVTTFLNRGSIESINKSADVENRKHFQSRGVHNPGRAYEPAYYSGSAPAPPAARGPGGRAMPVKGRAKGGTTAKKRGLDARRERSEARAKERTDRSGQRTSQGSKSGAAASPSSPAAPTTSESSGTTGGGSGVTIGR
jgi:hypothetical protein